MVKFSFGSGKQEELIRTELDSSALFLIIPIKLRTFKRYCMRYGSFTCSGEENALIALQFLGSKVLDNNKMFFLYSPPNTTIFIFRFLNIVKFQFYYSASKVLFLSLLRHILHLRFRCFLGFTSGLSYTQEVTICGSILKLPESTLSDDAAVHMMEKYFYCQIYVSDGK
jgi:hypothetical protein